MFPIQFISNYTIGRFHYETGRFLASGVWHDFRTEPGPGEVLLSSENLRKNKCGERAISPVHRVRLFNPNQHSEFQFKKGANRAYSYHI